MTLEVQAPTDDGDSNNLLNDLKRVRGRFDGVSVADVNLEGVVSDSIKTCGLTRENRFDAIYQTTTRDKNRVQLQKDLFYAYKAVVESLLVFTEDHRITGESPQESMFFQVDSGKLSSVLDHLSDGRTFDGKTLDNSVDFVVGAGVEFPWVGGVSKQGMYEMEAMKKIGTGYFLTTPVF